MEHHGIDGGAAPPIPVIEGTQKLGIKLIHIYGLTEVYGPSSICAEQPGWNELPTDTLAILKRRQGRSLSPAGSYHRA